MRAASDGRELRDDRRIFVCSPGSVLLRDLSAEGALHVVVKGLGLWVLLLLPLDEIAALAGCCAYSARDAEVEVDAP